MVLPTPQCREPLGAGGVRRGNHNHPGQPSVREQRTQPGEIAGLQRPGRHGRRRAPGATGVAHVAGVQCRLQFGDQRISRDAGRGEQQPGAGPIRLRLGKFARLPRDGEHPVVEHPLSLFLRGGPNGQQQTFDRQQDGARLIEHVDVGLTLAGPRGGDPGEAVAGAARRLVDAQPADSGGHQQATGTRLLHPGMHVGMGEDRLEACVQQRRVRDVGRLLKADRPGRGDLGQDRGRFAVGDQRRGQARESRTVVKTRCIEHLPHFGNVHAASMSGDQRGDVVHRLIPRLRQGTQDRTREPDAPTLPVGVDGELEHAGTRYRGRAEDLRVGGQQQCLFEPDVADLRGLADGCYCRRQRHLAVGGARKRGRAVNPVVAQPGVRPGSDVALPEVALRLLAQVHVRTEQGVDGLHRGTARRFPHLEAE